DQLDPAASEDELRAWSKDWLGTYQADGGVISTWQEMRTSPELAAFSRQVAGAVFTRLVGLLERRCFGGPEGAATTYPALLGRVPCSVATLRYMWPEAAVEAMVTIIRRGFRARADA